MCKIRMKHILRVVACIAWVSGAVACQQEEGAANREDGMQSGFRIQAECTDMLPQYIDPEEELRAKTRAVPKNPEEKIIKTLHLFFFDKDGRFLRPKGEQAYLPYQKWTSTNVKPVPYDAFEGDDEHLRHVQIYAVANIFGDKFKTEWTPDGDVKTGSLEGEVIEIKTVADLENWIYAPVPRTNATDITHLPEPGMPMVGSVKEVDLRNAVISASGSVTIPMKALMARVDISVKIEANQTSRDGRYPQLTILEYGVKNMPSTVPFTQPAPATATDISRGKRDMTVQVTSNNMIKDGDEPVVFTYYTYENIQQPIKKPEYPGNIEDDKTDERKQRWKPTIANKEAASALTLKGNYITHQGLIYDAYFTVYMGENTIDNFEVKRNRCYKNNIVIHGLDYIRNGDETVYTFDGRVNVKSDNPVYISIVNERKVDAHASVLPMDVYLLRRESGATGVNSLHSTVTVSLKDETGNAPNWIRMEKVDSLTMAGGEGAPEHMKFLAGTGARDYFTVNLLADSKLTSECVISGDDDHSRSRIYFYIDENIPATNPRASIPDRSATVHITYENATGEKRERTLEIDQKGMLYVEGARNGDVSMFIEYYEEYLEHADPLDKHEMPEALYEGLPWGLDGTPLGDRNVYIPGTRLSATENFHHGLEATRAAIAASSKSISTVKLYNTDIPATAFHYCYGKNKRNANGEVPTTGRSGYWELPAISDLEVALEQYYGTFSDFQGNLYWSAAAGGGNGGATERTEHARATRVDRDANGKFDHVGSGDGNMDESKMEPGFVRRNKPLRIRAAYKYTNQ